MVHGQLCVPYGEMLGDERKWVSLCVKFGNLKFIEGLECMSVLLSMGDNSLDLPGNVVKAGWKISLRIQVGFELRKQLFAGLLAFSCLGLEGVAQVVWGHYEGNTSVR